MRAFHSNKIFIIPPFYTDHSAQYHAHVSFTILVYRFRDSIMLDVAKKSRSSLSIPMNGLAQNRLLFDLIDINFVHNRNWHTHKTDNISVTKNLLWRNSEITSTSNFQTLYLSQIRHCLKNFCRVWRFATTSTLQMIAFIQKKEIKPTKDSLLLKLFPSEAPKICLLYFLFRQFLE